MAAPIQPPGSIRNAWAVLTLFLIPWGGGIPAGVVLAKSRHIAWPFTSFLYLISDIILAFLFEPLMLIGIHLAKRSPKMARVTQVFRESMKRSTAHYGTHLGPFTLILVAFGVDPMTGRGAAKAAGHGFVTGWTLAITGDMIYFFMIMASTLWLNNILGNGTLTTIIIFALMMIVPSLIHRYRESRRARAH